MLTRASAKVGMGPEARLKLKHHRHEVGGIQMTILKCQMTIDQ